MENFEQVGNFEQVKNPNIFGLKEYSIWTGAMIEWWDISEKWYRDWNKLPVVDMAVMTNACPRNCSFCFTDKNKKTLSLREIKSIIDELADRWTYAIDFLWEWEPTIDENFFEIIEYTTKKWIIPLVYSESALKMSYINKDYKDFIKRLYDSWASILPKMDSLFNEEYQNSIVSSLDKKTWENYFELRNNAIENLIKAWFNKVEKDWTTRMWFDMVLSSKNYKEVEKTLRYCRDHNLYIMFAYHLSSWRNPELSTWEWENELALWMSQRVEINKLVNEIDKEVYWIIRKNYNNFITWPCKEYLMIRWDWRVQPCPWNEKVIWTVWEWKMSISEILEIMENKYPKHNRKNFDWNCPYRPEIKE